MKSIVLTFHNVTDATWFEQCLTLIGRFYTFAAVDILADAVEKKQTLRNKCFITFDDGEKSFYQVAYPILQRLQIPVTVFVSPKNIVDGGSFWFQSLRDIAQEDLCRAIIEILPNGKHLLEHYAPISILKTLPLQQILQIIKIANQNAVPVNRNIDMEMFHHLQQDTLVTIGAHTMNHPILANETEQVAAEEIIQSITQLSTLLGHAVRYFAYPNGARTLDYTKREIQILQRENIRLAFSTNIGFIDSHQSPYEINRIGLTTGSTVHIMLKILFPQTFMWVKRLYVKQNETKDRLNIRSKR